MTRMVAVFQRAATDDKSVEVEVQDVVFDLDCVEDATTGQTLATVERRDGRLVFVEINSGEAYDTLTVVPR